MGTRMKIVIIAREILHPLHVIRKHILCKFADVRLVRAQIHRVRCVCHKRSEMVFIHNLLQCGNILLIDVFCLSATRISCKKRKGVCAQLQRRFPHFSKTAAR